MLVMKLILFSGLERGGLVKAPLLERRGVCADEGRADGVVALASIVL
jgi:hypothetical protein